MLYSLKHEDALPAKYSSAGDRLRLTASAVRLERGPLKGLRQTAGFAEEYESYLRDIDAIGTMTDGPFFAAANIPWMYLYTDLPAGSYSSLFVDGDFPGRSLLYWETFPEKKPQIVYFPKYDFFSNGYDCLQKLRTAVGGTVKDGEAGYFLVLN